MICISTTSNKYSMNVEYESSPSLISYCDQRFSAFVIMITRISLIFCSTLLLIVVILLVLESFATSLLTQDSSKECSICFAGLLSLSFAFSIFCFVRGIFPMVCILLCRENKSWSCRPSLLLWSVLSMQRKRWYDHEEIFCGGNVPQTQVTTIFHHSVCEAPTN